ncbi:mannose-1-phosphate guanylyltransferase [Bifidobacterium sp. SMB2]|uniref:Mannose-1-phosphate guanylyltransferase n=1 Tax=Bifidobacterium saimiriisciurei TaxID=2661627 RepID=A0ABX0CF07_9BIFI|nr:MULTISPECIES: sugar phosphate nucleotidyltransferase [Bifidobacterium]NEG95317.1 mannose-1-phosphate guanylyltransferase [Bifidobacterium sp. SMB2]NEH11499.1 mannose-1-phosphate guanylyltransferase [Bifidobacterium saimiriisciurei]
MQQTDGRFSDLYALIPAGGVGSRLWPLSRSARPKFLYDFLGSGRTMIQATFDRLAAVAGDDHVTVMTGVAHAAAVRAQLPELDERNLFAEPVGRDSTAAIALATAILAKRHGRDVVVGSFAADHVIRDDDAFRECVAQAVAAARAGYVTTIGIAATRPSTAFGYIRQGAPLADRAPAAPDARTVRAFVEKPDAETAQGYLMTGEYRWNAGMFVMRAGVLLDTLARLKPRIYETVTALADVWDDDGDRRAEMMERLWPAVEKIAFDYAVAEPLAAEGGVAMVPGGFGWDDIGDFNSVAALIPSADARNNKIIGDRGRVVCLDSAGNVVAPAGGEGRTIALLGADDLVVVDTPDALLVAPRARSQEVKRMAAALADQGLDAIL